MREPDYDAILAALGDPLGATALGVDGEPSLALARGLLPPLVGPTFLGDRSVPLKPVVQPDGTVAGMPMTPLDVRPGDMRCSPYGPAGCVCVTGTDAQGRRIRRTLLAVTQQRGVALWCRETGDVDTCWRSLDGAAPEVLPARAFYTARFRLARCEARDAGPLEAIDADPKLLLPAHTSLRRAINAFVGDHPKYGWGGYEDSRHDTFPPTILSMTHALCDWGLLDLAMRLLGHWLARFVLKDGSLDYYGPALSEYGMLLEAAVRVARTGHDAAWTSEAMPSCRRIADRLLRLYAEAGDLLPGLPEADFFADEGVEQIVYYSNNLWCIRGLREVGAFLGEDGRTYLEAAASWLAQTQARLAADKTHLPDGQWYIPAVVGQREPPATLTCSRAASYANYRFYPEMLSSDLLSGQEAAAIFAFREQQGGELCGTTRFEGWMDDWPAMEMGRAHLAYGRIRAAQRLLVGHLAFHHAAGHETAYEQVGIRSGPRGWREPQAGFVVPAQLVVPRLLRNLLVFEGDDGLWLNRGGFRSWLTSGCGVRQVPTRWGAVSFHLQATDPGVEAEVDLSGLDRGTAVFLRLRSATAEPLRTVEVNGRRRRLDRDILSLRPGRKGVSVRAW